MVWGHLSDRTSQLSNLHLPLIVSFETGEQNFPLTWLQTCAKKEKTSCLEHVMWCTWLLLSRDTRTTYTPIDSVPAEQSTGNDTLQNGHFIQRWKTLGQQKTDFRTLTLKPQQVPWLWCVIKHSIFSALGIHHAESLLRNHLPSTSDGIDLSLSEFENSTNSLLMKSLYVR